jgi:predicted metalloprotease
VEDRRGDTGVPRAAGVAPLLLRFLPALLTTRTGRTLLLGGVALYIGGSLLGFNPLSALFGGRASHAPQEASPEEQQMVEFVSVILADTEDTWGRKLEEAGSRYREPTLVLFTGSVDSACGYASAATGPFYCPADEKLYLDVSFFDELGRRLGAPGDFAQAYVIAHEVGHHVQNLLGIAGSVQRAGYGRAEAEVNALSVRMELQADCFAGLWAHVANVDRRMLEPGDLQEALRAASAIGDDRLQRSTRGRVVPDSFTHGTSEQRVRWFQTGFESEDIDVCDTFSTRRL